VAISFAGAEGNRKKTVSDRLCSDPIVPRRRLLQEVYYMGATELQSIESDDGEYDSDDDYEDDTE
jgi:hypothetical protein